MKGQVPLTKSQEHDFTVNWLGLVKVERVQRDLVKERKMVDRSGRPEDPGSGHAS